MENRVLPCAQLYKYLDNLNNRLIPDVTEIIKSYLHKSCQMNFWTCVICRSPWNQVIQLDMKRLPRPRMKNFMECKPINIKQTIKYIITNRDELREYFHARDDNEATKFYRDNYDNMSLDESYLTRVDAPDGVLATNNIY